MLVLYNVCNFVTNKSNLWLDLQILEVAPFRGQIYKYYKWRHHVDKLLKYCQLGPPVPLEMFLHGKITRR